MRRALATLQPLVLLAALLLSPVPADLACCAGLAPAHGGDCCDSAGTNALAMSCCTSGDSSATSHSELRLAPPTVALTPRMAPATPAPLRLSLPLLCLLPHTPDSSLYTLHSAFLI